MAADRFPALAGSGTLPYQQSILHTSKGGTYTGSFDATKPGPGHGERIGAQVIVANPEDMVASPGWATSGVQVDSTPTKIIGPDTNPLPRSVEIQLRHGGGTGDSTIHIGTSPDISPSGYPLFPGAGRDNGVVIPLLHNNEVWAVTETGTAPLHYIVRGG
jgi:hypothetical protein